MGVIWGVLNTFWWCCWCVNKLNAKRQPFEPGAGQRWGLSLSSSCTCGHPAEWERERLRVATHCGQSSVINTHVQPPSLSVRTVPTKIMRIPCLLRGHLKQLPIQTQSHGRLSEAISDQTATHTVNQNLNKHGGDYCISCKLFTYFILLINCWIFIKYLINK